MKHSQDFLPSNYDQNNSVVLHVALAVSFVLHGLFSFYKLSMDKSLMVPKNEEIRMSIQVRAEKDNSEVMTSQEEVPVVEKEIPPSIKSVTLEKPKIDLPKKPLLLKKVVRAKKIVKRAIKKVSPPKKVVVRRKSTTKKVSKSPLRPKRKRRRRFLNLDASNIKGKFLSDYRAPSYPRMALRRSWEGEVLLVFKVSPTGKVIEAKVLKSSGHSILDNSALSAAKKWVFKNVPAKKYSFFQKKFVYSIRN